MDVTRRSFAFFGAAALGGAMSTRAWADAPAAVQGVLLQPNGPACRVVVALDRPAQARTFFLQEPDRFVIDLANTRLALDPRAPVSGGVVRGMRCGPRPDGAARLVFDLNAPANVVRQELGGRRSPAMSFDLAATDASFVAPSPAPLRPTRDNLRRTIVVDAGHGGHDPGAIGATGVREKDVVLDAALNLRDALESQGAYRVALTRDADRFVPLEDRVRFARAQNADLFISIHADSSPNSDTTGASVYTLSEHGANRAQNIMGAQNWDLDLGDAPRRGVVTDILVDLTQRETTNRSAEFAELLIPRLRGVSPLAANTHRNAGFFVLLAPDVPAVLCETGFLSNVADERRLSQPRTRQAMAGAMAEAVDAYFTRRQQMANRA